MKSNRAEVEIVRISGALFVALLLMVVFSHPGMAQDPQSAPTSVSYSETYCSGFVGEGEVTRVGEVLGAEEGMKKNELAAGDLIYLGNGTMSNYQRGQEVFIIRPLRSIRNVGTLFDDIAHARIVDVHENVLVGEITFSCQSVNAGDWVIPPQSRLSPPEGPAGPLDRFAPSTGKAEGRIIDSKLLMLQLGQGSVVYLNVGTNQGVQVGATMRIFRPASEGSVNDFNRDVYRKAARAARFPRQILGDCVVLHAEENSSTAIITKSREEMTVGDRVELR